MLMIDWVTTNSTITIIMIFNKDFTALEKIQLLERWILVQSFAYYELDENIASDFDYDHNAIQLIELKKEHPDDFKRSRYYKYFYDYDSSSEDVHYVSGFDLLNRIRKNDKELHRYLHLDAIWALEQKKKHMSIEAL